MALVGIREAQSLSPSIDGKRVSRTTLWRWMTKGINGRVLPSAMVGGRRVVDTDDLISFFAGGGPAAAKDVRLAIADAGLTRYGF